MVTRPDLVLLGALLLLVIGPHHAHARIGTFWHVSDFHYDVNYTITGSTDNRCWNRRSCAKANSLGEFGDYECDSPWKLVQSATEAMFRFQPKPDFILWTGDDTAHVPDRFFSTNTVESIITQLTNELRRVFPNTTVFPVLGNHDYYPKNQIPPGKSDVQTHAANQWRIWFNNDSYDSFSSNGRYWMDVEGTEVTVVAINTLIWYKSNNHTALLPDDDPLAGDPDGHFAWLDDILGDLAARNRKVYLIGHIPPGTFERYQQTREGFHWYQERYNTRFIEMVRKHASVIEAQFFAHHHTDSFRLFFSDSKSQGGRRPVSYQLLVPGVTPWRSSLSPETGANNPGIRLVSYDTVTGKVTEVSTYYLDLAVANSLGKAEWKLEYNFTTSYNLRDINPTTLYNLTKSMRSHAELFGLYYRANAVGLEDPSVCGARCRLLHLCAVTEVDYDRFRDCNSGGRPPFRGASGSVLAALLLAFAAR